MPIVTEIAASLDAARDRLRDHAPPAVYLTVEEAARLARCNPKTVRRAFESGSLRAFRPARRVLLRDDDVRAWVEARAAAEPERSRPVRARRARRAEPTASVAMLRDMEPAG